MRYRRLMFLLLIIASPFILSLAFGWIKASPAQSADSRAMVAEPDIETETSRSGLERRYNDRYHVRPEGEPMDALDDRFDKRLGGDELSSGFPFDNPDDVYDVYDSMNEYNTNDKKVIIKGSPVIATAVHNAKLYNGVNGSVVQEIEEGQKVEILQDRTCAWYEVSFNDITGWVKAEALDIPPDPPTNPTRYSKEQLEDFINNQSFESKTPYLVWVDIDRQLVQIFRGSLDNWSLQKTMVCSTGKNESPTTRGLFMASDRDTWMYTPRLGSGAKNWVRFNNTYLFHSVAYAKDGKTVVDDTLGVRSSAGCIRLSLEDSQWIYDNIEEDTTVWVN